MILSIAAAVTAAVCGFHVKSVSAPAAMPIVVLDAGHGGEDGGAVTPDGVHESEINLAITKRLEQFLRLNGCKTVMVREQDTAIYSADAKTIAQKKVSDLHNRVLLVNSTPNSLLVSIHQNIYTESKYHGAQVFYAATDGSKALAELAQHAIAAGIDPGNHRAVKSAGKSIYLLQHIQCTGVLVECGFLSNPQEAVNLQQSDYQKKLACAISGALLHYLNGASENSEV
ncbi:MAG: N-acetylmuramoyl-L-alanine amidase [Oscillospiraceae bacterium]|nr:N-acetylmuramoyl-L-alanine amidase [Oscillospiraceae bacterium]